MRDFGWEFDGSHMLVSVWDDVTIVAETDPACS